MSLQTGDKAPAFSLPGVPEKTYCLSDFKGQYVVLYFYPRDDTPGCTTEACDFRDNWKRVESAKAVVLGVSADTAEKHAKFGKKFDLPFPLLADVDHAVCDKYGVWQEKSNYGKKYMGIERTTFLIDPQGKIAEIWAKVKVKGHVDAVLAKIEELSA
jgi:peroxiredoxin Q/BCP